jgi:hypothetical protein
LPAGIDKHRSINLSSRRERERERERARLDTMDISYPARQGPWEKLSKPNQQHCRNPYETKDILLKTQQS